MVETAAEKQTNNRSGRILTEQCGMEDREDPAEGDERKI